MGSGDWFKTIISRKKAKQGQSKQVKGVTNKLPNGSKWRNQAHKESNKLFDNSAIGNLRDGITIEDIAATRIQTAFRGLRARKTLRLLKGIHRLQTLTQGQYVKKQASTTLGYIQSWSKIQMQIKVRRACMVTEGRIKQRKQDNQLKLEAKLNDLEVEWCGGFDTMDEILARIQQREEAAVKRERAMAYAFSHQWRASSVMSQGHSGFEFGKGNWGWSWMDRWIAARPWECRLPTPSLSPKKPKSKAAGKGGKVTDSSARAVLDVVKPTPATERGPTKRSTEPADEKTSNQEPNSKPFTTSRPKTKIAKAKQLVV